MTGKRRFMNDAHRQFLASDAWGELLEAAGHVDVTVGGHEIRFHARKP